MAIIYFTNKVIKKENDIHENSMYKLLLYMRQQKF